LRRQLSTQSGRSEIQFGPPRAVATRVEHLLGDCLILSRIGLAVSVSEIVAAERLSFDVPRIEVWVVHALPIVLHIDLGRTVAGEKRAVLNPFGVIVADESGLALTEAIKQDVRGMGRSRRGQGDGRQGETCKYVLHCITPIVDRAKLTRARGFVGGSSPDRNDGLLMEILVGKEVGSNAS